MKVFWLLHPAPARRHIAVPAAPYLSLLLLLLLCAAACERHLESAAHTSEPMQTDVLYSVTATVDNTGPAGTAVYLNCPPDSAQVMGNNRATFRTFHAPGERYRVSATASAPGVACIVRNASGVMPDAPVEDVAVHCGPASRTEWSFDSGTQSAYTFNANVTFAGGLVASSIGHPGWISSNTPVGLDYLYAVEALPGPGGCPYITFNLSPDGVNWYTYQAGAWRPAPDDWRQGTVPASPDAWPIDAWADTFGPGALYVKVYLPADATYACTIDSLSIDTESVAGSTAAAGVATILQVSAFPTPTVAGASHSLRVTAYDAFGAVASGYTGTIAFSSTDGGAVLPGAYTFGASDAGSATFAASLVTAGMQAIAARDINRPAIAGSQRDIVVTPASAASFAVHGFPSPQGANVPATVCLTALDAYGNIATGFGGTMQLAASDPNASIASSATFTPADAGNICLPATFRTTGSQSIVAYSAADPSMLAVQRGILIVPGPAGQRLGGAVTNLTGGNIIITNLVDSDSVSVGNGNFVFTQMLGYGQDYNVAAPAPPGQSCSVSNGQGTMAGNDILTVAVSCTPKTYTLGGSVTGLLANTNVALQNGGDTISAPDGNFTFPTSVAYNSNFSASLVNPNGQTYVFIGNSNVGVMPPNNDSNIMVSCTANAYTLGGRISGLLTNTNVILRDGNDTLVHTNGSYTFPTPLLYSQPYSIGITNPNGQTCVFSPNSVGNGNMTAAPITNANVVCTVNSYPMGGYVTGLVTGNITLTNTVNVDVIAVGNGNYVFDQNIPYAGNYNVTAASPNGLSCSVTNGNAVMAQGGEYNVYIACVPKPYKLGGSVTGLVSNANVTLQDGNDTISVANGNFLFPTSLAYNSNFTVSLVNPNGQTCIFTRNSNVGVMPAANDTNVQISCTPKPYALGGSISGLLASTNVTLNDGNDTISPGTGLYMFPTSLPYGRAYSIGITNPNGQTCVFNPNSAGAGTMSNANVTNANVACSTNTYSLGGRVTGLVTGNITITNTVNADVIGVANGNYVFDQNIAYASNYNVVVTNPIGLNCNVTNGNAVMAVGGEFNVFVVCTSIPYTLGGSVSGLLSNTNVTLNNGNDIIPVANGNFTFPTSVAYNSNFSAGLINPNGQTCVFTSNSNVGVMPPQNDANIVVSCTTNLYSLGGAVTGLLSNTNVTLSDGNDTLSRANGSYTFPTLLPYQRTYSIGITNPAGQTCAFNPNAVGSGTMGNSPVTNANVVCTTNTYPLGGAVTGLVSGNVTLTNTVSADAISAGNGNFLFDQNVTYTGNYNIVTTSPNGLTCVVSNGTSTMPVGGNFNVYVTCTTNPAMRLTLTAYATPRVAGQNGNVTITAYDASNNVAIGYTGTVHITSTDANAAFSPNFTFVPGYAGSANVPITLKTAGTHSLTGNDVTTPSIAGRQASIVVNPATASTLKVSGYTTPRTAGQSGNITVTAYDAYANVATGYIGTVHVTSSDSNAIKPADYAFQAGNAGVASLPVTLLSTGSWAISANDTVTASIAGMQNFIVVNPNGAVLLTVSGYTSPRTAGQQGNVTVTAYDAYGNIATAYTGTIQVSSTDASAIKPANYTFTGANLGVTSLPVTLVTAGNRAISANDTTTASIAGMQNSIVVQPNVTVKLGVSSFPNPIYARVSGNVTIVPYDNYNNIVTTYAGSVVVTSSDGAATLPATAAYASPLVVTLRTPGLQSITATDQTTSSITGQQPNILVNDPNYYAIGGRITGLSGSVQLQNNGSDTATINANGPYFMPTSVLRSATYSLTVSSQPTGQSCSFSNASGTVVNANITNANVTCTYINYALGGSVSGLEASTSVVLANGSDTATVSANGGFFFPTPVYYAQNYNITISTNPNIATCIVRFNSGTMPNSNNTTAQVICTPTVSVANNQAANLFIGQANSSSNNYPGNNTATAASAAYPFGSAYYSLKSGKLYLGDSLENRILIYNSVPSAGSGASASAQIGQSNFANTGSGTSSTALSYPSGIAGDGNALWVVDLFNHRVLGYSPEPNAATAATVVLGQTTFTANGSGCSGSGMNGPSFASVAFGRLIVSDSANNRVLIWNSLPTSNGQSADMVLGQNSLSTCTSGSPLATNMNNPSGVWADGKRLMVTDSGNHRVLLWNNLESITTGQAADVVLGQSSMTTRTSGVSSTALNTPEGIASDGVSIFVSEKVNNRVVIWSSIPTSNGASINKILGQSSTTANGGGVSSTAMNQPQGVLLIKHSLLITDLNNNRWMGFGF